MKKNITRMLMLAAATVLTISMVFGLAGCAASGPSAYTAAEAAWKAAATKSVKDDITVSATMALGNLVGNNVNLSVNFELNRKYKAGGKVDEISGKIKTVAITGINPTLTNIVPTILNTLGVTLPPDININEIIGGGNVTLTNPAEGKIKVIGSDYVFTGSVSIPLANLEASTDDLEEEVSIPVADVTSAMSDLNLTIPFDLLTMYGFNASAVGKDNKVSFTGEAGLNFILVQVYALIDELFAGNVEFNGEEIVVPQDVVDIVEAVFGSTDSEDIKDYLIGESGLLNLGEVELAITYNGKKFNTISGVHTMSFSITKAKIESILNLTPVKNMLATIEIGGNPITPKFISDMLFKTVGLPNTINAEITVTFTSTYTY